MTSSTLEIASLPMTRSAERSADAAPIPLGEAAFERFYARTSRPLWAYLSRVTGDPAVADDVHQESYLRYLTHPPRGGADADRDAAYLYRIASNLLRDRWRQRRRRRDFWDEGAALAWVPGEGGPAHERTDLKVDVEAVLGELAPRQRALLWLAYVEGYRHTEIAEILGLRPASIRVLLFRARRKLAALLRRRGLEPTTIEGEVRP